VLRGPPIDSSRQREPNLARPVIAESGGVHYPDRATKLSTWAGYLPSKRGEAMRRLSRTIAVVLATLLLVVNVSAQAPKPTDTVYVTKTGAKYHRAGCRSLIRSQIAMTLKEASARYAPCLICKPPVLSTSATTAAPTSSPAERLPPTKPAEQSVRCQAITKKGTQCSRNAKPGSRYCWQHAG
jgi:hypothetical protein